LPPSFWADSDSMHVAFVVRLATLLEYAFFDTRDNVLHMDLNTADEVGEFWKGMILSLNEGSVRTLKRRQD